MKAISVKTLKNRMSDYFHEVEATGKELLITQDGQLVLKIISYQRYSGKVKLHPKELGKNR